MPPTTWKLNIWAAKMKAAMTPMSGIARSSSVWFVRWTAKARTTAVMAHMTAATREHRNPSGACMVTGSGPGREARRRWLRACRPLRCSQRLGALGAVGWAPARHRPRC